MSKTSRKASQKPKATCKYTPAYAVICAVLAVICIAMFACSYIKKEQPVEPAPLPELAALPTPEVTGGVRGELGIDKNINESTIDQYLGRYDSAYRDMRMLEDPGNYEAIGGDRFLSGFVEGFEVVSLPYLAPVSGLPEAVGDTYKGDTLFSVDSEGNYVANYEESLAILQELFPKDKNIFLMCGGGGYAGMTKAMLVSLGWDASKIWNVGGYWYYEGEHNVEVKKTNEQGETYYDFDSVNYHEIKFDELTPKTKVAVL